jgi:cytochrome c biogenesis protein CcmG, thiol:disulfide interchange protein DsbE
MKSLKFIIPLLLFAGLAVLLGRGLSLDPREVPSPLVGKPAPAFMLTQLDDPAKKISRDDLLGQVWVLNVFASWCATCHEEHPVLVDFAKRSKVPLIGLNYKDGRTQGLQWLGRLGNPYKTSLWDNEGRVGLDFGVYGVPETFVIDRQGVVRYKHIGALTPAVMREKIEPLLKALNG